MAVAAGLAINYWRNAGQSNIGDATSGSQVAVPPAELPGLGYLPETTEAILALQLPALSEKFAADDRDEPAKALAELGLPRNLIATLEKLSGVGLKNVDHLIVGLGFAKGSFPPQVIAVVHTRQPFDIASLARETDARTLKKEGRTLYGVRTAGLPEVYWWAPNDRVLVATLLVRDFETVPQQPVPGLGLLKPQVAGLIRDRIAEDAVLWLAATSDRWGEHLRPYTFRWAENLGAVNFIPFTPLEGRNDLIAPAERLRSVTMAIPQSSESPVDVQIELKSAAAAEDLRRTFIQRFDGEPIDVTGDGEICRLRTPFDRARVGALIAGLVGR